MNDAPDHYEETPAAHLTRNQASGQSPGDILREARLAHDYGVEDLCAQTKLSPKAVKALEDNDFGALSQPVFARGYYRQCAKVLDIDTDRLMAAYSAWGGEAAPQPAAPTAVNVVPQDVTPHRWRALGLICLLLVLLVAIGAVFLVMPNTGLLDGNDTSGSNTVTLSDNDAPSRNADTETNTPSSTLDNETAGSGGVAADATSGTPAVAGNDEQSRPMGGRNVNDTLGRNSGAAAAGESAEPAQPAKPAVGPNHLRLTFTDRSWVDVRDAKGSRLLTGIYEAGDSHEFDGNPPYKVTLGYAPGVNVSIGGKAVDVAAQTTSNSTAHLTVSARSD